MYSWYDTVAKQSHKQVPIIIQVSGNSSKYLNILKEGLKKYWEYMDGKKTCESGELFFFFFFFTAGKGRAKDSIRIWTHK